MTRKRSSRRSPPRIGPPKGLSKADIARSAKLRKGGESVIETIAALSEQFGLVVPNHPTAEMVDGIAAAKPLVAVHKQLATATKNVSDVIFSKHSQSWASASVHYSMLRRLAKTDGDLAKALLPVQQFFAARSKKTAVEQKAQRGGFRKGSAKAKAFRAAQKEAGAKAPANDAPASDAPAPPTAEAPSTPSPAPQANGAAH